VVYDDGEDEWLALPRQAFRWLAPRARSAGCTEPLKRALSALGAQGENEKYVNWSRPLTASPAGPPACNVLLRMAQKPGKHPGKHRAAMFVLVADPNLWVMSSCASCLQSHCQA